MNDSDYIIPELDGKLTPDSFQNFNELFQKLLSREIAVFVGAGMSYETGIPTWKDFLEKLANDLYDFQKPSSKISEPEYASKLKSEYEARGLNFFDKIKQIITDRRIPFLQSHVDLLSDDILFCITTNFDNVFDETIRLNDNLNVIPQYYPTFRVSKIQSDRLCYLHGNVFHSTNIIFTEESYYEAYRENGYIDRLIKPVYKENLLLFLGVSFEDKALKSIIEDTERYQDQMWGRSGPHFIFLEKSRRQQTNEPYKHEKLLKELNLNPIFYYKTGNLDEKHYNMYYTLNYLFNKVRNMRYRG